MKILEQYLVFLLWLGSVPVPGICEFARIGTAHTDCFLNTDSLILQSQSVLYASSTPAFKSANLLNDFEPRSVYSLFLLTSLVLVLFRSLVLVTLSAL
jgi:hypothetical protein